MTKAHEGLESKTSFDRPDGIINVNICNQSGKLPTELCTLDPRGSTVRSEIFVKGTEPKEHCDAHVEADIDITNGKLANEYCPEENIETKIFVQTMPPYIPADNAGLIPIDFHFRLPLGYCEEHDEFTVVPDENLDDEEDDFDYFFPFFPKEDEGSGDEDDEDHSQDNDD